MLPENNIKDQAHNGCVSYNFIFSNVSHWLCFRQAHIVILIPSEWWFTWQEKYHVA